MPVHSVGGQRWTHTGENSGGDKIYERSGVSLAGRDYDALTKDELQELLELRGLPKSGNKEELVARLQESD